METRQHYGSCHVLLLTVFFSWPDAILKDNDRFGVFDPPFGCISLMDGPSHPLLEDWTNTPYCHSRHLINIFEHLRFAILEELNFHKFFVVNKGTV